MNTKPGMAETWRDLWLWVAIPAAVGAWLFYALYLLGANLFEWLARII